MRIAIVLFALCITFVGCVAQEEHSVGTSEGTASVEQPVSEESPADVDMDTPKGWQVRLDRPDPTVTIGTSEDDDVYFVNMAPGWHVTTHKAGIFYHPENTAQGAFSAKASIFLFDPGDRNREAFGMFVGGQDLDADTQAYTYFLIRNEGDFLVKERIGSETNVLVDWTHSDAVVTHPHDSTDSVLNILEVIAGDETVDFLVNGTQVARLAVTETSTDGVVGLRLNHGLNVHVSEVSVGM